MTLVNIQNFIQIVTLLVLVSCAAPKAISVTELPEEKKEVVKVVSNTESKPPTTILASDGMRLPDMLTMPTESELLPTNSIKTKAELSSGAVISRPPMDALPDSKLTTAETKKLN